MASAKHRANSNHGRWPLFRIVTLFAARTFDFFFSLRGYGQTHIKKSACTRGRVL